MKPGDNHSATLRRKVDYWARRLKVKPKIVRIVPMTRKWGSCSTLGIISLAADLINQEPGFQDFVIVHELLHLRIPNHGKLFKATMTAHVPNWRELDLSRMGAAPMPTYPAAQEHKALVRPQGRASACVAGGEDPKEL